MARRKQPAGDGTPKAKPDAKPKADQGTPKADQGTPKADQGTPKADQGKLKGQEHRDRMARRSRDQHDAVAEIGELPPVKDPARKERGRLDLEYYLAGSGYFPNSTGKSPFCQGHRRVLQRFQSSILLGELDWNIVFRGFAKTTLSVGAVLWGASYGHLRFVPVFGATKELAINLVDLLKSEWETNDRLYEDFPEICHAVRALEGKHQRCGSQTYRGELTNIEWKGNRLVLPTIPGSAASGFCAVGLGLKASIRGLVRAMPDGTRQRPDWFIIDDPQTDQSAASPAEVAKRLNTIRKAILKLGGNQSTIGGVINGTIIEPDDVMDQIRDHARFPQFQGEVVKMVDQWADAHETFWLGPYRQVLTSYDPAVPNDLERAKRDATTLYAQHMAEANLGCRVAWDHCYDHDWELSAIQHAYNLLILDGEDVFACECQSEPIRGTDESGRLALADVQKKLSGYAHREIPAAAAKVVAAVDVQDESLWYAVIAFTPEYSGYVVDYGVWPEPARLDGVSKRRLKRTLSTKYADQRDPAVRIRCGLTDLADQLLGRAWLDADGREHRISSLWVDQADGQHSKAIRAWARTSRWSSIVRPFGGLGIGPAEEPLPNRAKRDNELRRGLYWIEERDRAVRGGSIIKIDKNWWSSFAANRWRAGSPRPDGDKGLRPSEPGAMYLYGAAPYVHATFAAHQIAESCQALVHKTSGRSVSVWRCPPSHDNEWWDCLVACCAAADYAGGVELRDAGLTMASSRRRKRYTAAELKALKEAKQNGR